MLTHLILTITLGIRNIFIAEENKERLNASHIVNRWQNKILIQV